MSCAVNLLPESCHNAHRRAARRNAWSVVVVFAALALLGTWTALHAIGRSIDQLNRELTSALEKQSELDCQLTLAIGLRNSLAQRARALAELRHEQLLPLQLFTLARQAPAGVVLTEIRSVAAADRRPTAQRPARSPNSPTNDAAAEPHPGAQEPPPVVQLSGFAVDHDELTRLIDTLQGIPQWKHVELLRATREPYLNGIALAFRLECRSAEVSQ